MATRKSGKTAGARGGKLPSKPQDQRITSRRAIELTQRYRRAAPASEHSGFFFAQGLTELLAQPGVYGMRIYHGLDEKGAYRMVLVGVDQKGNDIVKRPAAYAAVARAAGSDAVLLDGHWPCPPFCPTASPLN